MARKNENTTKWDSGNGLSRSTIISGIIAIVVIVGLFVLFNALPGSQPAPPADEQTQEEQTNDNESAGSEDKNEQDGANSSDTQNNGGDVGSETIELPSEYTTVKGDSLWKISENHYGNGYGWTKIANKNGLSDPDVIHPGQKLTIPKAEMKAQKHNVVQGDNLWNLAEKYYGSGFEWQKILNANQGQIGELPNGQPLITPGQVLSIP